MDCTSVYKEESLSEGVIPDVSRVLCVRLLEVKLALRYPNYKIVLQPGRPGGIKKLYQ